LSLAGGFLGGTCLAVATGGLAGGFSAQPLKKTNSSNKAGKNLDFINKKQRQN
jgi:hypothetical protein